MIDTLLENLLKDLRKNTKVPKFIFNDIEKFDTKKSNVFYSAHIGMIMKFF